MSSWITQLSMLLGLNVSVVACFLPCLFYSVWVLWSCGDKFSDRP